MTKECCTPSRLAATPQDLRAQCDAKADFDVTEDSVDIPGGTAFVGTGAPKIADDGEGPLRKVKIAPFRLGRTCVTNADFARFVEATGYQTEAEIFGWSFVFWSDLKADVRSEGIPGLEWWRKVDGAYWRDPKAEGRSVLEQARDYPVVHISWNDAAAYARWAGGRLPTEAEWEHAARGGLGDVLFPWGSDEPNDTDQFPCNIWQGAFPNTNTGADGYIGLAPAKSFKPNGYGLYNMVGNNWEWSADPFKVSSLKKQVKARLTQMRGFKLVKGGSALCHKSYCFRYRIAARTGNSPDSTTGYQGFRVAWDTRNRANP
jgi:formylglycine-generating enzyme required for sulfatase activity